MQLRQKGRVLPLTAAASRAEVGKEECSAMADSYGVRVGRWIVRGTWRQFRQRQFEHQPRNLLVAFRSLYYVKAKIYNLENIYFSSLTLLKLFSDF